MIFVKNKYPILGLHSDQKSPVPDVHNDPKLFCRVRMWIWNWICIGIYSIGFTDLDSSFMLL
jgi:hypothetical protein